MSTAIAESRPEAKVTKINIRARAAEKKLIKEAANSLKMTVAEFVLPDALARAKQTLKDQGVEILDQADRQAFVDAFLNPPKPPGALQKAVAARKAQPPV